MSTGVTVTGSADVLRKLERLHATTRKGITSAIKEVAVFTESLAKQFAPVDTGRLKTSIHWEMEGEFDALVWHAVALTRETAVELVALGGSGKARLEQFQTLRACGARLVECCLVREESPSARTGCNVGSSTWP